MSTKIGAVALRQTDSIYALVLVKRDITRGGGLLTSGSNQTLWLVKAMTTAYGDMIIGMFDEQKDATDLLATIANMLCFTRFGGEFAAKRSDIVAIIPKQVPNYARGSSGVGGNIANDSWYVELVLNHQTKELCIPTASVPTFKEAADVVAQFSDIINAGAI